MGRILCFLYDEVAEFEVTFLLHRLKSVGRKEITAVGYDLEPIKSQSGLIFLPDATVKEAYRFDDVEALIIPGGPITEQRPELTELIQKLYQKKKLLAAICYGPQFLGRAGILEQHQFTTSCSEEHIKSLGVIDPYPRQNYLKKRVVRDQNVITATGRAFIDFSFEVFDWLEIFSTKEEMIKLMNDIRGIRA